MANDGEHLAAVDADAVKDFRMADDLEAGMRLGALVETGEDFEQARHGSEAGDDHLLPREDGTGGAQAWVDGVVGCGVVGSLVFDQGLFKNCIDAAALPFHRFVFRVLSDGPVVSFAPESYIGRV